LKVKTIEQLLIDHNVPKRYAQMKFEDLEIDKKNKDAINDIGKTRDCLSKSNSLIENPLFLILKGDHGNGKTRCAVHLMESAFKSFSGSIKNHFLWAPYFLSCYEIGKYRFDFEEEAKDKLFLFKSGFLVLDDVGRFAGYKGELEFLQHIIEKRYNEMLSTVLTGNTLEHFSERFQSILSQFDLIHFGIDNSRRK